MKKIAHGYEFGSHLLLKKVCITASVRWGWWLRNLAISSKLLWYSNFLRKGSASALPPIRLQIMTRSRRHIWNAEQQGHDPLQAKDYRKEDVSLWKGNSSQRGITPWIYYAQGKLYKQQRDVHAQSIFLKNKEAYRNKAIGSFCSISGESCAAFVVRIVKMPVKVSRRNSR